MFLFVIGDIAFCFSIDYPFLMYDEMNSIYLLMCQTSSGTRMTNFMTEIVYIFYAFKET